MSNKDRNFRKALLLRKEQADEETKHDKDKAYKKKLILNVDTARKSNIVLRKKLEQSTKRIEEFREKIKRQRDELITERDTIKQLELKIADLGRENELLKKRKYTSDPLNSVPVKVSIHAESK